MIIVFYNGNLKDCLMKVLSFLLHHNHLNPSLDYVGNKIRLKFNGDCLEQEKLYSVMEK